MNLSKAEIILKFDIWLNAWNEHKLEKVMQFMHEEVEFENWNGQIFSGKNALQKAWLPWFISHGNFKFFQEDLFVDEQEQKICFTWKLEWPSIEKKYLGKSEIRTGMDVLHLKEGKVYKKYTYSKTYILIDSEIVNLYAE